MHSKAVLTMSALSGLLSDEIQVVLGSTFPALSPNVESMDTGVLLPCTDITKRMARPSLKAQEAAQQIGEEERTEQQASVANRPRLKLPAMWTKEQVRD